MNGLQGARVLVLDDDAEDALAIVKAFSRVGIPVAYFDGTPGSLPTKSQRLSGVRLAILDMNLDVPGPNENIVSTLVQTLSGIMRPDNGPFGVLVWTDHPDLRDLATRYIFERTELPRPVFVDMLRKANFLVGHRTGGRKQFAMRRLSRAIHEKATERSPLRCFEAWESLSFQAATRVTNQMAEHRESKATTLADWAQEWRQEANRLLLSASKAQAGEWHNDENCIPSLFLAMNPLHADRMEGLVDDLPDPLPDQAAVIMGAGGSAQLERRARMNTMLHLGADRTRGWRSGNLYVFTSRSVPRAFPRLGEVMRPLVEKDPTKEVLRSCRLCGVEITPACDYAQKKAGFAKLLMGVMISTENDKNAKFKARAGFLKRIGPLFFDRPRLLDRGTYYMILNSQFVATARISVLNGLRATARVRPQLLADIQVWAAFQGARQGVLFLGG